jgi:hypothetical protein
MSAAGRRALWHPQLHTGPAPAGAHRAVRAGSEGPAWAPGGGMLLVGEGRLDHGACDFSLSQSCRDTPDKRTARAGAHRQIKGQKAGKSRQKAALGRPSHQGSAVSREGGPTRRPGKSGSDLHIARTVNDGMRCKGYTQASPSCAPLCAVLFFIPLPFFCLGRVRLGPHSGRMRHWTGGSRPARHGARS